MSLQKLPARALVICLLMAMTIFGKQFPTWAMCEPVFSGPPLKLQERADRLERKLERFERPLSESREEISFKPLIERLREFGSTLDFDIVETVVAAIEASGAPFRTKGSSATNPAVRGTDRPDSQTFRNREWDLNLIGNYFFASPSIFTFSKKRDLVYLQHVLQTARRSRRGSGLNTVVLEANRSWNLRHLQRDVPLYRQYLKWEAGRSNEILQREFIAQTRDWIEEASATGERVEREKFVRYTVDSLKNDWSTFDLYILERYFNLVRKLRPKIDARAMILDRQWQMTDWRVLEFGLAGGSLDYVKTFLEQVAHDADRKIALLRVLDKMEKEARNDFSESYRRAFKMVAAEMPDQWGPKHFASDLHVFTVFGDTGFMGKTTWTPRGLLYNPMAVHVLASWNPKLGRLESNIIEAIPLNDVNSTLVSSFQEIQPLVSRYFDVLRQQKGTLTEQQVNAQEERELTAKLTRTTFFIAMERGEFSPDKMMAMSRIFYGGPRYLGWTASPQPVQVVGEKTYIEEDFPNFVLPERKQAIEGFDVYELGRLLATEKSAHSSSTGMVQYMADYFVNSRARGAAYMDGGKGATRRYQRMGAKIVAGAAELGLPQDYKPVWILRVPVDQMTRDFAPDDFNPIQLRPDNQP